MNPRKKKWAKFVHLNPVGLPKVPKKIMEPTHILKQNPRKNLKNMLNPVGLPKVAQKNMESTHICKAKSKEKSQKYGRIWW